MGNQDLDHALNPWMYNKSGDLTPQAQQQFPDLANTPAAITTGGSPTAPAGAGGQQLVVHPDALRTAGQNASELGNRMTADCQNPTGSDMFTAATAMNGWAIGAAITTAHQTWELQFLTLGGNLITVGQNLQDSANGYTSTENTNRGHMRALDN
ncbi:hypothetical protein [Streptacidiphilus fuscans]|uniref:Uncharacterized protein n=1 Tax=Streptacidiphilus fuscans TaxID=2789292 RepID=A0A931B9N2_9ACTN|nr:hypothetical protein [Streptacidiphilus fuscans]MBF9073694.1 hypothetical protein [Streptacidiphilus fuscans]